jgi:hypothetical protein
MVHNPTRKPRKGDQAVSNRRALAVAGRLGSGGSQGPGKRRLTPRSASGSFIARRTNNNWKRFPPQKRKGEVAFTKDIAGRKLRKKNFETKRPDLIPSGGMQYGTKQIEIHGRRYKAGGRSATVSGEKKRRLNAIPPRFSGAYGLNYSGRVKGGRPLKGGGSVSGRTWNNRGQALPPRSAGVGSSGLGFKGRLKGQRPLRGGGSVSGKVWNNRGQALPPRSGGIGSSGLGFSGRIKGQRPLKGGGSVSGKVWNNRRTPIGVRPPSTQAMKAGGYPGKIKKFQLQPGFADQGEEYTGYLRARKPKKLAGSVSGKVWNNKQQAVEGRGASLNAMRAGRYQGNLKASKPRALAGSASGKLWNNRETPIPVRTPPPGAEKAAKFPGKIKRFTVQPGFSDQGEEFTGYIKRPWYRRSYSRNPNAHEKSLKQESPSQITYQVGNLHVAVKTRKYVRNKKLPEDALRKLEPTKSTYQVDELQVRVRQKPIGKKPHGVEGSLPGVKPTREAVKASEYARSIKRDWKYIRNPSSAKEALRVREPGKAFARATDYQGNIKMRKFGLFEKSELHPDARFVKINKNNVAEERGFFTNIKLWWAKTFKKNENQPDHLKEKGRKPRYDKGEQGLWYD